MKDFTKDIKEYNFEDDFSTDDNKFDEEVLSDVDFSQITGNNFRKSFSNVKSKIKHNKKIRNLRVKKSLNKNISVRNRASISGKNLRKLGKIITPADRKVIIQHVNKFILSDECSDVKNINFHNGKKLKEVVLVFNNNGLLDFNLQLFNPSMMLDYLYSTSLNLNDQVRVADGTAVSYSDVLYNILANPLLVYNAKVVIAGPSSADQINQPLRFINKDTQGQENVAPISVALQIDNFQKIRDSINFFCIDKKLNRPFIADGMDVIEYTVLAGNTVTIAFFCKQILLKNTIYKNEIAGNKKII